MQPRTRQGWLAPLATALPMIILPIAVSTILLATAQRLQLSERQTANWILAVYAVPCVVSLLLSYRYRQPLLMTGNVFALIFVASLGDRLTYGEIIGVAIVTGACILLLGALGLTARLAIWIPAPVVMGLLAGAVMPYVAGIFTAMNDTPWPLGGALVAYFWGRRASTRVPPILPAAAAALAIAAVTGDLRPVGAFSWVPKPAITAPVFTLEALVTGVPVLVVIMTLQSNVPSLIFLRGQGYEPPEGVINTLSGVVTAAVAPLGPIALSLSLPATSLVAGPDSGERAFRYRAVYISAGIVLVLGLLAELAAQLTTVLPLPLLLALAGLATVSVLIGALQQVTRGPLVLGPVFAFAIALSDISLLGLGPFFWALAIGTGVSLWLEREGWQALHQPMGVVSEPVAAGAEVAGEAATAK